jgi:hypothetical protein
MKFITAVKSFVIQAPGPVHTTLQIRNVRKMDRSYKLVLFCYYQLLAPTLQIN